MLIYVNGDRKANTEIGWCKCREWMIHIICGCVCITRGIMLELNVDRNANVMREHPLSLVHIERHRHVNVTVYVTLTGSTFDLSDGYGDRQNGLQMHFARQQSIFTLTRQWRLVWTAFKPCSHRATTSCQRHRQTLRSQAKWVCNPFTAVFTVFIKKIKGAARQHSVVTLGVDEPLESVHTERHNVTLTGGTF